VLLAGITGLVLLVGNPEVTHQTRHFGVERLVAMEALPEMNGPMCELVPASAGEGLIAALKSLLGDPPDFPNCRGPRGMGDVIPRSAASWRAEESACAFHIGKGKADSSLALGMTAM